MERGGLKKGAVCGINSIVILVKFIVKFSHQIENFFVIIFFVHKKHTHNSLR